MSKGIYNIALVPYDQHYILTVCVGLTMEEILDKFRIDGAIYPNPPKNLRSLKNRSRHLEVITSQLEFWDMRKYINEIETGKSNGVCLSSDELDEQKTIFMFLPDVDYADQTKESLAKLIITVSHETIHVCQFFLPKYLKRDDEPEAEAYFHDYIVECIVEAYMNDFFH